MRIVTTARRRLSRLMKRGNRTLRKVMKKVGIR